MKLIMTFLFLIASLKGFAQEHFDVTFFGGTLWGKGQEYVRAGSFDPIDPNFVVSQLDWPIENLFVLGGTLNFNFLNNCLHFTIEGWSQVASKKVKMIDEDFLTPDPAILTNISVHPQTRLNGAYKIFGETTYDIFNYKPLKMGGILGFQYSQFKWQSFNGSFLYFFGDTFENGFFDGLVIKYQQMFSVPYFGVIFKWQTPRFMAALFGKFSPITYAQDIDNHHIRKISFIGEFLNKTYYMIGAKAGIFLSDKVSFDLKYTYEEMKKEIGDVVIKAPGFLSTSRGGSFIAHNHNIFEMGFTAHF